VELTTHHPAGHPFRQLGYPTSPEQMAGDYRDRFAAQARRWQAQDGLDDRTRANVDAFAANVDEHLVVLDAILALMDEVAPYTIEAIMARSDLELGLEALLGRPNPRPER